MKVAKNIRSPDRDKGVRRAIEEAREAGVAITGIEIDRDGTVTVLTEKTAADKPPETPRA